MTSDGLVVLTVIGYNSRQETEVFMKEYGGIGPWFSPLCIVFVDGKNKCFRRKKKN
jgi:hypothetical protein